jgi:NAD-dependent dihydropyrimidine dehydrogenase PreA subunit
MLDRVSFGLPETESGLEIKILKKLFSEEDARIFLKLSFLLESTKKIASKIGLPEAEAAKVLEDMANRGLLYSLKRDGKTYYAAVPFVHGLFEYQVRRPDKEFAKLSMQYIHEELEGRISENAKHFLRVIPVNQAVDVTHNIASFEDAVRILESKDNIVVTDCVCRTMKEQVDGSCKKPLEVCFLFGSMGQYYLDRGLGRKIVLEEALKIQKLATDAGLVTQPGSSINPDGMCNCCGDCCGNLGPISRTPKPAQTVLSNYYAQIDRDECDGCGECIERCQMTAVKMGDDQNAEIDRDRCIGCGLCVTTCPTRAITLRAKDEKDRQVPVKTGEEQMLNIARNRGAIGKFFGHEIRTAYHHQNVFGVLAVTARIVVKAGQKLLLKRN